MRDRYFHRKITPGEFRALLAKGRMKVRDFMFVTGRTYHQVNDFLLGANTENRRAYTPTMADVVVLELCARNPAMLDQLTEIANDYSEPVPAGGEATIERRNAR